MAVFLIIFCAVMFFAPELGGYFLEYNNFIPADSLKTPPHIAPVWYFTPYYTILRATTDPMVNALCAIVGLAALLNLVKGKGSVATKGIVLVAAVVLIALMKYFDAKFWGVVLMGGAVVILFFLPWLDSKPGQVDPLSAGLAQAGVRVVRGGLPDPRLPGHAAGRAQRFGARAAVAGVHADLFRVLPADALVEPARHVQAGARARDLQRPLRKSPTP